MCNYPVIKNKSEIYQDCWEEEDYLEEYDEYEEYDKYDVFVNLHYPKQANIKNNSKKIHRESKKRICNQFKFNWSRSFC
jgi:hypothetical protein